jgi:hypothetical protein
MLCERQRPWHQHRYHLHQSVDRCRTDPFRELDRLAQQAFGTQGTAARLSVMPMDAWREGESFHVEFDLPGVDPASIEGDLAQVDYNRQHLWSVEALPGAIAQSGRNFKIDIALDLDPGLIWALRDVELE